MRDVNPRSRERFDLSLDGRQISSVVVGAIVVLAVVFVLGLSVGKQLARGELPRQAGGDALAALDQPTTPAPAVRDESLTYHDRLIKERPSAAPAESVPLPPAAPSPPPSAAPPEVPPAAEPVQQAVPDAPGSAGTGPSEPPTPRPAPVAAPESPAPPARAAHAGAPSGAAAGDWCVQVGAANDRAESERIAAKFERFSPRIETAIVQGKTWHRVRVGAFATRAAAEKYLKDLSRETGAKGYVTSTR